MTVKDTLLDRVLKNWGKLVGGSTAGAVLGLLSTLVMAKSVDVYTVGVVALIQTFWRSLEGFLSFQSYQVFIKYGTVALTEIDSRYRLSRLFSICLNCDVAIAAAGSVLGVLLLYFAYQYIGIPEAQITLALSGVLCMSTMVSGAYQGVLRLFDRFELVAYRDAAVGVVRLIGAVGAYLLHGGLVTFVLLWVAAEVIGNFLIVYFGTREFKSRGYGLNFFEGFKPVDDRGESHSVANMTFRVIVPDLLKVNVATMIRISSEEGDILLLGHFARPETVGIYRIAKTLAGAVYRLIGPLQNSIYPEIAHAVAVKDRRKFSRLYLAAAGMGGGVGLVSLLFWVCLGNYAVEVLVGTKYLAAVLPIQIISAGYFVGFVGIASIPSLYAFNQLNTYLLSAVVCTLSFFLASLLLMEKFGINAVAIGQLVCYSVGLFIPMLTVWKSYTHWEWRI